MCAAVPATHGGLITLRCTDRSDAHKRSAPHYSPWQPAGQGSPGRAGGPAGGPVPGHDDPARPRFERDGDDLRTRVSAPLQTMVLGGEVHVPTPDGRRLALK